MGGFVSSQPRKKGFDKLQDMSLGGCWGRSRYARAQAGVCWQAGIASRQSKCAAAAGLHPPPRLHLGREAVLHGEGRHQAALVIHDPHGAQEEVVVHLVRVRVCRGRGPDDWGFGAPRSDRPTDQAMSFRMPRTGMRGHARASRASLEATVPYRRIALGWHDPPRPIGDMVQTPCSARLSGFTWWRVPGRLETCVIALQRRGPIKAAARKRISRCPCPPEACPLFAPNPLPPIASLLSITGSFMSGSLGLTIRDTPSTGSRGTTQPSRTSRTARSLRWTRTGGQAGGAGARCKRRRRLVRLG